MFSICVEMILRSSCFDDGKMSGLYMCRDDSYAQKTFEHFSVQWERRKIVDVFASTIFLFACAKTLDLSSFFCYTEYILLESR